MGLIDFDRYNVPRAFLKPFGNVLVILEELKGDPHQISLNTISVTDVHESLSIPSDS